MCRGGTVLEPAVPVTDIPRASKAGVRPCSPPKVFLYVSLGAGSSAACGRQAMIPLFVGREKVNCPVGAREAGLGHDLGAPLGCFPISPPEIGFFPNEPGPGRRVTFCMDRKSPKNHQGDAQDGRSAPIFASPWTPFTGDTPEKFCKISGAQSQECLPAVLSGPIEALSGRKFAAGAVQELRLGLPSQRNRCESRREAQGPPLPNLGWFS